MSTTRLAGRHFGKQFGFGGSIGHDWLNVAPGVILRSGKMAVTTRSGIVARAALIMALVIGYHYLKMRFHSKGELIW